MSSVEVSARSRSKVTVIGGGDLALACLLAISAKVKANVIINAPEVFLHNIMV